MPPRRGFAAITTMLLDKGADPNQTDKFNKTVMDYAIEADKMQLVDLLKKHGAKSSAVPKKPSAGTASDQGAKVIPGK